MTNTQSVIAGFVGKCARWTRPRTALAPAIRTAHCLIVKPTSFGAWSSDLKVRWITIWDGDVAYASPALAARAPSGEARPEGVRRASSAALAGATAAWASR